MSLPIAISWGPGEILVVLFILLLLFGSSKLPKLARGLGSSVTEFRKGLRGDGEEDDEEKKRLKSPAAGEEKPDDGPTPT